MVLRDRLRTSKVAKAARKAGEPVDQILDELPSLYTSRSFLAHRLSGRGGKPRAWPPFPTFSTFLERLDRTAGTSGVVWDPSLSIEEIPTDEAYDFTAADSHHNFIADGFVVSNCGVRRLRTTLMAAAARPRIRPLTHACFENLPR